MKSIHNRIFHRILLHIKAKARPKPAVEVRKYLFVSHNLSHGRKIRLEGFFGGDPDFSTSSVGKTLRIHMKTLQFQAKINQEDLNSH